MRGVALLLLCLLFSVKGEYVYFISNAASCEVYQGCTDESRSHDCVSMKKSYHCREWHAAGFTCRDDDAVNPVDGDGSLGTKVIVDPVSNLTFNVIDFTMADAARRMGMTCKSFPFYNGGYPMIDNEWMRNNSYNHWKNFDCTARTVYQNTAGASYEYCSEWTDFAETAYSIELNKKRYYSGAYSCYESAQSSDGSSYCLKWRAKLVSGFYDEDDNQRPFVSRYLNGTCDTASAEGVCLEMTQVSIGNDTVPNFMWSLDYRERQKCESVSPNGKMCERWVGTGQTDLQWTVSNCECVDSVESAGYCAKWNCYLQSMPYFFPSILYCLIILIPMLVLESCYARDFRVLMFDNYADNFREAFRDLEEGENLRKEIKVRIGILCPIVYLGMTAASAFLGGLVNVIIGFLGTFVLPYLYLEMCTRFGDKVFGTDRYWKLRAFYADLLLTAFCMDGWVESRQEKARERREREEEQRRLADQALALEEQRRMSMKQKVEMVDAMYAAVAKDDDVGPEYYTSA